MKNSKMSLIESWEKSENEMNTANPIVINNELMNQIHGGVNSAGYVCTLSGECSGRSCYTVRGVWDTVCNQIFG